MNQENFYKAKLEYEIDAYDLYESLENKEQIVLIDVRAQETFVAEHIKGAINLYHRTMSAETTAKLNKSSLYVTYSDGVGCNASTKGALNLTRLGFKVKELIGGLDWWILDGYETDGEQTTTKEAGSCDC
jgi:rhodanese-related sulfurtransferase